MLHHDRVYMLAADHRWQWEEWCDARSIARSRIPEVKQIAYDGFVRAREQSPDVRANGALLIDEQYAADVVAAAMKAGITVGTPAEKPGAVPLAWTAEPFSRALTGAFVKVLVRYRPEDDATVREEQWKKLDALQTWSRNAGQPLVVEILVARRHEPEAEFESSGRPAILAAVIGEAYGRGLVPDFWKIEGSPSTEGARIVDAAIAAQPSVRQIILGKGADLETITRWFAAVAPCSTAVGFAIGRSVVWDPAASFLSGATSASRAAADIAATYLRLVTAWNQRGR